MISVKIEINNKTIYLLTATNLGIIADKPDTKKQQWRWYGLNDGCRLKHDRMKGALCLMIQMAGHAQLCGKVKYRRERI